MSRMYIVYFGPVGVGKSTSIRYLRALLIKRKIKVKSFFFKSNFPLFLKMLARFSKRNIYIRYEDGHIDYTLNTDVTKKLSFLLIFLDLSLLYIYQLLISMVSMFSNIVIFEEYLFGTLCEYLHFYRLGYISKKQLKIILKYMRIIHLDYTNLVIIILDSPNNILKSRWKNRGTYYEHKRYIDTQRILIDIIKKNNYFKTIYVNNKNLKPVVSTYIITSRLRLNGR